MAIVKWNPAIDTVSGALVKAKKQDGHVCGEYLIGTHRTAPTQNPNCNRVYVKKADAYVRKGAPSMREMDARDRFAAVAAAIKARKEDLQKISQDQAAFLAQKDSPNGKKTMKAFYWKLCGDLYDEQHS